MSELPKDFVYDQRIVDRLIKKGVVQEKDFERHLKSLPDLAKKFDKVEIELEEVEIPSR